MQIGDGSFTPPSAEERTTFVCTIWTLGDGGVPASELLAQSKASLDPTRPTALRVTVYEPDLVALRQLHFPAALVRSASPRAVPLTRLERPANSGPGARKSSKIRRGRRLTLPAKAPRTRSSRNHEEQAIGRRFERDASSDPTGLRETVKWGNGCWIKEEAPIAYVYSAPDHTHKGPGSRIPRAAHRAPCRVLGGGTWWANDLLRAGRGWMFRSCVKRLARPIVTAGDDATAGCK